MNRFIVPYQKTVTKAWQSLLLLAMLALAGCATQPKQALLTTTEKEQHWANYQQVMQGFSNWKLVGRIALKVTGQSGTLSVDWEQTGDTYQLFLDGPFATSIGKIYGNPQQVTVIAGEQQAVGKTPEDILEQLTGLRLPIGQLRYWVRALPAPKQDFSIDLNAQGLPDKLYQSGWQIQYLRYQSTPLAPAQITVSREGILMRLIVNQWQFVQ